MKKSELRKLIKEEIALVREEQAEATSVLKFNGTPIITFDANTVSTGGEIGVTKGNISNVEILDKEALGYFINNIDYDGGVTVNGFEYEQS